MAQKKLLLMVIKQNNVLLLSIELKYMVLPLEMVTPICLMAEVLIAMVERRLEIV